MKKKQTLQALALTIVTAILSSCAQPEKAANIESGLTKFPTVETKTLDGQKITLPDYLAGQPAILIVGYLQEAQFDIDRWLYSLIENKIDVPVYEVPTISGLVPRFLSETINKGMQSGIPSEDWPSVATVYQDADQIVSVLGNQNPQNGQVVLLNATGRIVWNHNRGYSPRTMLKLISKLKKMRNL
jgi:hypothetical protein